MAIFQPSNVIPSSFAGIGGQTVDANDNMSVSWQVNGNSPMTAFKLQIYNNKTNENVLDSTIITLDNPFYGVDNKGNPKQFTYSPANSKWSAWGVENGNEYKMIITQFWDTNNANSVTQYSGSVFLARETPTVSITFNPALANGKGTVAKQSFGATVIPQGTTLNSVRWQFGGIDSDISDLTNPIDESLVTIIDDTGAINTAVLEYEYAGLFSGKNYAINCIIETQEGIEQSSGWQAFTVSYEEAEISESNIISTECLADDSVLLSWAEAINIKGTMSPTGATPTVENGLLELGPSQSVTWDNVNNNAMNFPSPWTMGWKAKKQLINKQNSFNFLGAPYPVTRYSDISENGKFFAGVVLYSNPNLYIYDFEKKTGQIFNYYVEQVIFYDNNHIIFETGSSIILAQIFYSGNSLQLTVTSTVSRSGVRNGGIACANNKICALVVGPANVLYVYNVSSSYTISYNKNVSVTISDYFKRLELSPSGVNVVMFSSPSPEYRILQCTVCNLSTDNIQTLITAPTQSGTGYNLSVNCITFIDDYNFFVGGGVNNEAHYSDNLGGFLYLYNISTVNYALTLLHKLDEEFDFVNVGAIYSVSISEDGKTLILGTTDTSTSPMSCYILLFTMNKSDNYSFDFSGITFALNYPGGEYKFTFARGDKLYFSTSNGAMVYQIDLVDKSSLLVNNSLSIEIQGIYTKIYRGSTLLKEFMWVYSSDFIIVSIMSNLIRIMSVKDDRVVLQDELILTVEQNAVSSVKLMGKQSCDWLYIGSGDIDINKSFTPKWGDSTLFLADFLTQQDALQAGTSNEGGSLLNAMYRQSEGESTLNPVLEIPTKYNKIKDYGIKSGQKYSWEMFYLDGNSTYSKPIKSGTVCRQFRQYSLLEARQDDDNANVYHVIKVWRFGNNLSVGGISNNNTPNWLTNFTPYRLRQPTARLGQSGTLQALLSNFNQSENFYNDTIKMADDLKNASASVNTFFLKDMKGNLYMVGISGPITQTTNIKSKVQEITISVPWEEVGDANNVSLIQLPDDEGWGKDGVMDVSFIANSSNGVLSVKYPQDYYGTTFEMNNNYLKAVTPKQLEGQVDLSIEDGAVKAKR